MARVRRQVTGTLFLRATPPQKRTINFAAALLQAGGLVAFPTETVYGLGAALNCPAAITKIFAAKGRPADNPLIVHIAHPGQLGEVAATVPEMAQRLAGCFWPGPLSLILPRSAKISPLVSAGLSTVAVRMPDHPVALALITAAKAPLVAPSANLSGRPSPTSARHVLEDLVGKIDAVLDGGTCPVGVESTVLDLSGIRPVILRPGAIAPEELATVLGVTPVMGCTGTGKAQPPPPGMKYRHYAPRGCLYLITGPAGRRRRLVERLTGYFRLRGLPAAHFNPARFDPSPRAEPSQLARDFYAALRRYDQAGIRIILAEEIPSRGVGAVVMNRLRLAATRILHA